MIMAKSRGRRSGDSGTREAIAQAALDQFAARGFERTTIRSVAAAADVDPALVMHYFGSKRGLFLAAVQLPFDPSPVIDELAAGPLETVGRRLALFFFEALRDERPLSVLLGRVRAAASDPVAAHMVRDLIADDLVGPLARRLGVDRPQLRSALVSTQLIGYVTARWMIEIEALAGMSVEQTAALLGPTLQRYLVEPLD